MLNDTADSLALLVEASMAFAGFSGIVIAISSNPSGWTYVQRFRTQNLLFFPLVTALIVFILLGLSELGVSSESVALSGNLLIMVVLLTMFVRGIIVLKQSTTGTSEPINLTVFFIFGGIALISLGAQLMSILRFFPGREFGLMYFGLVALLLVAGVQFFLLVLNRPRDAS